MTFMTKNKLKLDKHKYGIRDFCSPENLSCHQTDYLPFEMQNQEGISLFKSWPCGLPISCRNS